MVSEAASAPAPLPDFEKMEDHDLLVTVATGQHHMRHDITKIEEHGEEVNGTVADLLLREARRDGAMWVLGGLMTIGIAVAGLAVTLIVAL